MVEDKEEKPEGLSSENQIATLSDFEEDRVSLEVEDSDESDDTEADNEEGTLYEHHRIVIGGNQSPIRIDKFLSERLGGGVSRNRIQSGLDAEAILVNDIPKASNYKIRPRDVITIFLPKPVQSIETLPEAMDLDIVYEDEWLAVINKPAGLVVHPGHGNYTGTLINGLLHHFQQLSPSPKAITDANEIPRPGLVHRIDKDTSGLLVIAKDEETHTRLAKQFFNHTVHRRYHAIAWGSMKEPKGTIKTNLYRSAKDRKIMANFEYEGQIGKPAITHYTVLQELGQFSLLEMRLETGRTHQIRTHLMGERHPILNDAAYGGDKVLRGNGQARFEAFMRNLFIAMPRMALHAKELGFTHPKTKEEVLFVSEYPNDFAGALQKIQAYVASYDL
jgi:23S rRNA pseudouridine1911/1915/1917 synthase